MNATHPVTVTKTENRIKKIAQNVKTWNTAMKMTWTEM